MGIRIALTAMAAVLALASHTAAAQRFYVGATGGTTHVASDSKNQFAEGYASQPGGIVVSDPYATTEGFAGRLFAGLWLTDAIGLEADFTRLGDVVGGYRTEGPNVNPSRHFIAENRQEERARAFGIAVVARAPISDRATLMGRLGAARVKLEQALTGCFFVSMPATSPPMPQGCITTPGPSIEETRPVAGLGLDWQVADRFAVRVSWDRYFDVGKPFDAEPGPANKARGEYDIDYFGVGVTYAF